VSTHLFGKIINELCEWVESRICIANACERLGHICDAPGCDSQVCMLHERYCPGCEQRYCEDCYAQHLGECGGGNRDAYDCGVEQEISEALKESQGHGAATAPTSGDLGHQRDRSNGEPEIEDSAEGVSIHDAAAD
jgi:hypothetical protein